jgi:hypothetical protein
MTTKVHGAAYAGIWVEKQVTFVKLTFNKDIRALAAADLVVLGTATPAGAGTVADSSFAVVESVIVSALKTLATRSTLLAISETTNGLTYDVMLGHAAGWFSDAAGLITAVAVPVLGAQAVVTTAGAAPTDVLGATVGVTDVAVTVSMSFSHMDGTMPAATLANGGLTFGPGATPGNQPSPGNTPTGAPGYYPTGLPY